MLHLPDFFSPIFGHILVGILLMRCVTCVKLGLYHTSSPSFGGKTRNHARTINPIRLILLTSFQDKRSKPKEMDHFFLLIMSIIIFFMQCGFAFMEAGAVR